jgi:hypothetical protein
VAGSKVHIDLQHMDLPLLAVAAVWQKMRESIEGFPGPEQWCSEVRGVGLKCLDPCN